MRSSMHQKHREAGDSKDKAGEAGERTLGRAGHLHQEFGFYLRGNGSIDEIKQRVRAPLCTLKGSLWPLGVDEEMADNRTR